MQPILQAVYNRLIPKMWSSVDILLKAIMYFSKHVSKWEREESKTSMFLFGLVLVVFCPVLLLSCAYDLGILVLTKIVIPLSCVFLMLCVGLPAIAFMRWLYISYTFVCNITGQFYMLTTRALGTRETRISRKNDKHSKKFLEDPRFMRDDRSNVDSNSQLSDYEYYDDASVEM